MDGKKDRLGLILTGGGARSAYQVGVLKAISEMVPKGSPLPFPVITGTSAGAVSATVLASRAGDFRVAVRGLEDVWANFRVSQVFRADGASMLRAGLHWLLAFVSSGLLLPPPRSLFDNTPLRELLTKTIPFAGVSRGIKKGHLHALGICATGFTNGRPITFFQGHKDIVPWSRSVSGSRRVNLSFDHLMASLSIPFLFPAQLIDGEYWGDGAMRQSTPLSPAINLGADRLLIIGVRAKGYEGTFGTVGGQQIPTAAQIFGYMLDTLFMDQIYADLEQLQRLNEIVRHAPVAAATGLRTIRAITIAPAEDLREIATRHLRDLPYGLRALLRTMGAQKPAASSLASYLMFESPYTRELIALGHADAMTRRDEILEFLHGGSVAPSSTLGPASPRVVAELRSAEKKAAEAQ